MYTVLIYRNYHILSLSILQYLVINMSDAETDGIDTVDLVEMPKETFTPTKGIAQTEGDIDQAKKQIEELQQRILRLEKEEKENENEHSELLREHAMLLQEKQEEHLKYLRQRMAMEEQQYNDEVSGRRLMEAEIQDASQQDIEGHFAAELRYLSHHSLSLSLSLSPSISLPLPLSLSLSLPPVLILTLSRPPLDILRT
eukprot:TRINITY_DN4101_c0_g1_i5.p1 TRINITY_DN4101_c0_g1~~TRINITY_DN4101_c0_g1_i5.p1  ORF type:complete len:199 (+),score=47.80 TRINITY_DN4101_c0_g1_i5:33-629(+)